MCLLGRASRRFSVKVLWLKGPASSAKKDLERNPHPWSHQSCRQGDPGHPRLLKTHVLPPTSKF